MKIKKLLSAFLAVAMTFSLAIPAFATSGNIEADASTEGGEPVKQANVKLPTAPTSGSFDVILDPHDLISKTDGARYAVEGKTVTFAENQKLFFKHTDKDGNVEYKATSPVLSITNRGYKDTIVNLTVEMTKGDSKFDLVDSEDKLNDAAGKAQMYLAVVRGTSVTPVMDPTVADAPIIKFNANTADYIVGDVEFAWGENAGLPAFDATLPEPLDEDADDEAVAAYNEELETYKAAVETYEAALAALTDDAKTLLGNIQTQLATKLNLTAKYTAAAGTTPANMSVTTGTLDTGFAASVVYNEDDSATYFSAEDFAEPVDSDGEPTGEPAPTELPVVITITDGVASDAKEYCTITLNLCAPDEREMDATKTQAVTFVKPFSGAFAQTSINCDTDAWDYTYGKEKESDTDKKYFYKELDASRDDADCPNISFNLVGDINGDRDWDSLGITALKFKLIWDVADKPIGSTIPDGSGFVVLSGDKPTVEVVTKSTGTTSTKAATLSYTAGTGGYADYVPSKLIYTKDSKEESVDLTVTASNKQFKVTTTADVKASGANPKVVFTSETQTKVVSVALPTCW